MNVNLSNNTISLSIRNLERVVPGSAARYARAVANSPLLAAVRAQRDYIHDGDYYWPDVVLRKVHWITVDEFSRWYPTYLLEYELIRTNTKMCFLGVYLEHERTYTEYNRLSITHNGVVKSVKVFGESAGSTHTNPLSSPAKLMIYGGENSTGHNGNEAAFYNIPNPEQFLGLHGGRYVTIEVEGSGAMTPVVSSTGRMLQGEGMQFNGIPSNSYDTRFNKYDASPSLSAIKYDNGYFLGTMVHHQIAEPVDVAVGREHTEDRKSTLAPWLKSNKLTLRKMQNGLSAAWSGSQIFWLNVDGIADKNMGFHTGVSPVDGSGGRKNTQYAWYRETVPSHTPLLDGLRVGHVLHNYDSWLWSGIRYPNQWVSDFSKRVDNHYYVEPNSTLDRNAVFLTFCKVRGTDKIIPIWTSFMNGWLMKRWVYRAKDAVSSLDEQELTLLMMGADIPGFVGVDSPSKMLDILDYHTAYDRRVFETIYTDENIPVRKYDNGNLRGMYYIPDKRLSNLPISGYPHGCSDMYEHGVSQVYKISLYDLSSKTGTANDYWARLHYCNASLDSRYIDVPTKKTGSNPYMIDVNGQANNIAHRNMPVSDLTGCLVSEHVFNPHHGVASNGDLMKFLRITNDGQPTMYVQFLLLRTDVSMKLWDGGIRPLKDAFNPTLNVRKNVEYTHLRLLMGIDSFTNIHPKYFTIAKGNIYYARRKSDGKWEVLARHYSPDGTVRYARIRQELNTSRIAYQAIAGYDLTNHSYTDQEVVEFIHARRGVLTPAVPLKATADHNRNIFKGEMVTQYENYRDADVVRDGLVYYIIPAEPNIDEIRRAGAPYEANHLSSLLNLQNRDEFLNAIGNDIFTFAAGWPVHDSAEFRRIMSKPHFVNYAKDEAHVAQLREDGDRAIRMHLTPDGSFSINEKSKQAYPGYPNYNISNEHRIGYAYPIRLSPGQFTYGATLPNISRLKMLGMNTDTAELPVDTLDLGTMFALPFSRRLRQAVSPVWNNPSVAIALTHALGTPVGEDRYALSPLHLDRSRHAHRYQDIYLANSIKFCNGMSNNGAEWQRRTASIPGNATHPVMSRRQVKLESWESVKSRNTLQDIADLANDKMKYQLLDTVHPDWVITPTPVVRYADPYAPMDGYRTVSQGSTGDINAKMQASTFQEICLEVDRTLFHGTALTNQVSDIIKPNEPVNQVKIFHPSPYLFLDDSRLTLVTEPQIRGKTFVIPNGSWHRIHKSSVTELMKQFRRTMVDTSAPADQEGSHAWCVRRHRVSEQFGGMFFNIETSNSSVHITLPTDGVTSVLTNHHTTDIAGTSTVQSPASKSMLFSVTGNNNFIEIRVPNLTRCLYVSKDIGSLVVEMGLVQFLGDNNIVNIVFEGNGQIQMQPHALLVDRVSLRRSIFRGGTGNQVWLTHAEGRDVVNCVHWLAMNRATAMDDGRLSLALDANLAR